MKEKLWKKCGTAVDSMHLELYDDARNKIADLSDNSKPLGFYSPLDGSVSLIILFFIYMFSFLFIFCPFMFLILSIKRDLDFNSLNINMIHGRILWSFLIHIADSI